MAMTHAGYLMAGYSITLGAIAGYAAWISLRQRAATKALESARTQQRSLGNAPNSSS